MRIGVIDSDAIFQHPFFYGKKIEIKRMNPGYCIKNKNFPFSHAEYVCACILLENPTSEILLYNIIGGNAGNEGELLYRSLEALIEKNVDIINISLGVEIPFSKELYDLCKKSPVPIVAAHANNNQTAYPASYDNVIGIRREFDGNVILKRSGNQNLLLNNKTYVSFKQLDQEHLMQGNSWYTAKLTGIISCFRENKNLGIEDIVDLIMSSSLNQISSVKQNNSENAICKFNCVCGGMCPALIEEGVDSDCTLRKIMFIYSMFIFDKNENIAINLERFIKFCEEEEYQQFL